MAASLIFVALAPLLALFAFLLKLDSGEPIMFEEVRRGKDGREFRLLKFRTMRRSGQVTRNGGFLRRWSLNELPQLFNVLRGDMTLVGPRPRDRVVAELLDDRFPDRPNLTPGLTGTHELEKHQYSIRELMQHERDYAREWSLWRDVRILVRVWQVPKRN